LLSVEDTIFSLKPFWDKVMLDCRQIRHDTLLNSTQLLKFMCQEEYVEVVDEVAAESVTDQKLFDQVLKLLF
jgi:hypothetical protein